MQTQNYKNHVRYVPLYHFILFAAIVALMVGSVINLVHSSPENVYSASLLVLVSVIVLLIAFFAREFAIKAQDKAIVAGEDLRCFILTGKPYDTRINIPQKIALRFAGDDEFVALVKKAADQNLSQKEIKMLIKNWKADNHRV